MKKIILVLVIACSSSIIIAQSKAISGSFGVLNPKLRVQYEHGLGDAASVGVNTNIYFVNWKGPRALKQQRAFILKNLDFNLIIYITQR